METQVEPTHYNDLRYNDKGRFASYWHQLEGIMGLKAKTVLETGTGNGLVKFLLQKNEIKVTTIDIDADLHPDVVGSVLKMPFADKSFDVVACCQVLEHIPYDSFTVAMKEIHRVSRRFVVMSLPDLSRIYRFQWQIPLLGEIKFLYKIPRLSPQQWEFNGEHYWNIANKGYSLTRIENDIRHSGFKILNTFCVFEMAWHRFFILEKQ